MLKHYYIELFRFSVDMLLNDRYHEKKNKETT